MSTVQIDQLWVPDSLGKPDAADFLASVEVCRQVRMHTWGNDDLAYTADEMLQAFNDPYERYVVLLARVAGKIVGRTGIAFPLTDATHLAYVTLDILPSAQGQGIGRELLAAAEQFVRGENRRVVMVETSHPAPTRPLRDEERLGAANGVGFLPLSSREVIFAQKADYELQQVEQFSACRIPLDKALVAALKAGASAVQGGRYALHQWLDSCPEAWLEEIARLESVMGAAGGSVAGPADDGVVEEAGDDADEPWTGERLREAEALALARGRRTLVTAVEESASGTLVGFTSISVLGHRSDVVFQDDTVVLPEHRGIELGLLIKVANMEMLAEHFPLARTIYTWNASENTYMLEVNGKLGFVHAGVTGRWQKNLDVFG
ncbi:MAG: GNAT family N-acetyltransferase [Actinomycetota bacterium]|nr:GNAT family N-acetyltransferase [Actinomycetota bacterium]